MKLWIPVLLWLANASAQQLSDSLRAQLASIEKQRAGIGAIDSRAGESLTRQRESVQRQQSGAPEAQGGFFTVGWLTPLSVTPAVAPAGSLSECRGLSRGEIELLTAAPSVRTGVSQSVLAAVIRKESANQPCAVSPKGAMGLMQLMPETARGLGVADPFDPRQNVEAGSEFLSRLLGRYHGDLGLALAAYNAGPARVDRAGGTPAIAETQDYVRSILDELKSKATTPPDIRPLP